MKKQQQFCICSSCFPSKKRKERDHQEASNQASAELLPLFNESPSWIKKPKSSSKVTSIVSSRAPGKVLKEARLFHDNGVNKINSTSRDSKYKESDGRDSRNNEVLDGLLPLFNENPSWVTMPRTSGTISSIAPSRIRGRGLKELKLFDDNWVPKNSSYPDSRNKESAEELERKVAFNLKMMRSSFSLGDLLEEVSRGVSTQLTLYHHDPFKIKKKMTPSDLGYLCRLLVSADLVEKHILPFLNRDQIEQVEAVSQENNEFNGLKVWVWDMNTETMHQLVFKRWRSSKSYIFNDGWTKHFVRRRNLVEGDEIGLYWDNDQSRFHLSVLSRAAG